MAQEAFDPNVADQAKRRIRQCVEGLHTLAQGGASPDEFFPELLERFVEAMQGEGGAVWMAEPDRSIRLEYQLRLGETQLLAQDDHLARHGSLLAAVIQHGKPLSVPPGADNPASPNPTAFRLLMGPLSVDGAPVGVLEIVLPADTPEAAQRGQAQFLMQLCQMAGEVLRGQSKKDDAGRQQLVGQIERFTREVHRSLDPKLVAYTVANEGRTLAAVDRVSVAIRRGRKHTLTSISGLESVERRANGVRLLERLIDVVVASGEPLWYSGEESDLPPQITEALQVYLDESNTRALGVIPLVPPVSPETSPEKAAEDAKKSVKSRPPLGALVVELFGSKTFPSGMIERVDVVAEHSALALDNALAVDGMFLMPLWRALGRATWVVRGRTLPKTLAIVGALVALILILALVPADFELHGRGSLEPRARRDVFADIAGVIDEVNVEHGDLVELDQPLAKLRNDELELQLTGVVGKRQETQKNIESTSSSLVANPKMPAEQRSRLASDLKSLEKSLEGLLIQEALLTRQAGDLVVRSPSRGQITTWDVKRLLLARPVERGQVLLSVAELDGEWVLEIRMPEDRMGHVAEAWQRAQAEGKTLTATFVLATDPGVERIGEVREIASRAELNDKEEQSVLITVAFDKSQFPKTLLRPGAAATVKIACGRRSVGYVWFHDLLEWFQREVLFRL